METNSNQNKRTYARGFCYYSRLKLQQPGICASLQRYGGGKKGRAWKSQNRRINPSHLPSPSPQMSSPSQRQWSAVRGRRCESRTSDDSSTDVRRAPPDVKLRSRQNHNPDGCLTVIIGHDQGWETTRLWTEPERNFGTSVFSILWCSRGDNPISPNLAIKWKENIQNILYIFLATYLNLV